MGIPPPPPPGSVSPIGSAQGMLPIIGQSISSMSQSVMPPTMGLTPMSAINQSSISLSIRGDLMPLDVKMEMEVDQGSTQESECEPPAPGTEELPVAERPPSPSKFLLYFILVESSLKY